MLIVLPGSAIWSLICMYATIFEHQWVAFAAISVWDWTQLVPALWLLAYLPLALRRVYGGQRCSNAVRGVLLLTVHLTVVTLATVIAESSAILAHG